MKIRVDVQKQSKQEVPTFGGLSFHKWEFATYVF